MDKIAQDILVRFEARVDAIADEIADATITEVAAFGPMTDERLRTEVRALARGQLDGFLAATRAGTRPGPAMLQAVRDRATTRARQLVPLAAMLHSFMIAQRVISAAITREAGHGARARGAALTLTALTFDYNIAVTTAMADAYVEAVQGDTARTERQTFVVSLGSELLAVLDARRPGQPRAVLHRTATQLLHTDSVPLRAGIGTPFTGIARLHDSYHAARRALRHATPERPLLQAPGDLRLFDELTASRGDDAGQLIPPALRETLADPQLRQTLQAWVDHDLNVAATAKALCMHPNSVRYRLRRIAQLTGHDPHHLTDLLELHSAARLLSQAPG